MSAIPSAASEIRMRTRRVRWTYVTALVMLALYAEVAQAWLVQWAAEVTRQIRAQWLLIAALGGLVLLLISMEDPLTAGALAAVGAAPPATRLVLWAVRQHDLSTIVRRDHAVDGLPSAQETLLEMGLEAAAAERIAGAAGETEMRLATFDYESRILSEIGLIPCFEGVQATPQEFQERDRHRLELVIARGIVCVKKIYLDRTSFENELLALQALAGIPGVPRVIAAQLDPPVVYQSFIMGKNLGSLMIGHGAPDEVQHAVSVCFAGSDRWSPEVVAQARDVALTALSASINPDIVTKLGRLVQRIHERGVTIGDIKYGNVLLTEDQPSLCDFDFATVFRGNGWRCLRGRDLDREKFNYFFDGGILSEREFRAGMDPLLREKEALRAARIHYGHGSTNHAGGSLARGSGQWRLIRPYLPDLVGKSVLDLGGSTGLVSLEMLRAGARRVTAFERDSVDARYARLNHRWFEFVDNREYPGFQLMEGPPDDACDHDWAGYDLAIALDGLDGQEPETIAHMVRRFSRNIDCLVVRAGGAGDRRTGPALEHRSLASLQRVMGTNGYPDQLVVEYLADDRPILIGRRTSG